MVLGDPVICVNGSFLFVEAYLVYVMEYLPTCSMNGIDGWWEYWNGWALSCGGEGRGRNRFYGRSMLVSF